MKRVFTFFSPPIFPEDEDKTRKARLANAIALILSAIALTFEVVVRLFGNYRAVSVLDFILLGVVFTCFLSGLLLRRGYVQLGSILLVVLIWSATNGLAATGYGARDSSFILNFSIVLIAGLLLRWQASLIVTVLSALAGLALAYAEQNGLIRGEFYPITAFARDIGFLFILNMALIYLLIHGLEGALKKSRINLVQLEVANLDLNTIKNTLQTRSEELLQANQQLESRTKKLQAIAAVARTIASVHNFDLLLSSITSTVSKQLGCHHVALFLLDEQREYAILRSSNMDAGRKLSDYRYRIPVRSRGTVSLVVQTSQPQVIPTAEQSVFLHQVGIPVPGSEIVLPLRAQDQVIGILVLQALESNAFSKDDISILALLGDQIAITIQNLLLYEQSENALRQADMSSMQSAAQAWKVHGKGIETRGYHYDGIKSEPLREARTSGNGNGSLLVPVQLRGQTIGSFKLNALDESRTWTDDELIMVRATAERVALALESARLLQEAEKRAAREAFLADVSTKLSSSFQMDSILRDTVQELGETLKQSTVTFQLVNPATAGRDGEQITPSTSQGQTEPGGLDD